MGGVGSRRVSAAISQGAASGRGRAVLITARHNDPNIEAASSVDSSRGGDESDVDFIFEDYDSGSAEAGAEFSRARRDIRSPYARSAYRAETLSGRA